MIILGLSAFYHDSAAAVLRDGHLIAAAQEERFTRRKHDEGFPGHAIDYCLAEAQCDMGEVDHVVFYEKPFLKFERLIETYVALAPRGFTSFRTSMPLWIKHKLFQKKLLRDELRARPGGKRWNGAMLFAEHHASHAASAFYPSPFESAAVLTMDGVGEWCTTSIAHGRGNALEIEREIHFPHSLGLLYSAFTHYTGFKVNSGEYKVMGLAPYGRPRYRDLILDHLIDLRDDGSFRLDQRYFDYCGGLAMTSAAFHDLFGAPPREREAELTQREMDLAASVQAVTEEAVLRLAREARRVTGERNLCLAGGVALNCVANGRLIREKVFERVWVQPAAGDAGGALGAALAGWHQHLGEPRQTPPAETDGMRGAYLGPAFTTEEAADRLAAAGARFDVLAERELIARTADLLAEGRAVGWMSGRMEFGPRALGARSILGDPRSAQMQRVLNLKVKFRESFRPFAPSVLREDVGEWFEHEGDSPYMLVVADVARERRHAMTEAERALFGIDKLNVVRSEIPAVTHVDYSARVQTVHRDTNPRYHALISAFRDRTGCPVLVNTSFNVRGEPIVCTPEDAFRCFMGTGIDALVVENCLLTKAEQSEAFERDYTHEFELD